MDILLYTHSDYFDILKIQLHYFSKYFPKDSDTYLCSNKLHDDCIYKTLLYDDTLPYASRILSCIKQLETQNPYVLIIHENDILLRYKQSFIDTIIDKMDANNIDSVELKQAPEKVYDYIKINEHVSLTKKIRCFYVYTVQPTIWLKSSIIELLSLFSDKTYRTIECVKVQTYVTNNYKTYILNDYISKQSIWYRVTQYFAFLHVTSREKLLPCTTENGLEDFIQDDHLYIQNTFLSETKRTYQKHIFAFEN